MTSAIPLLTLFYDSSCALCNAEMARLARWDEAGRVRRRDATRRLAMIDCAAPDFRAEDYGFTFAALDRQLHGVSAEGEVLRGLDAIRRACALTRYGWLWRVTALPGLKPLFDRIYLWVARNRLAISRYARRYTPFGRAQQPAVFAAVCTEACATKFTGRRT